MWSICSNCGRADYVVVDYSVISCGIANYWKVDYVVNIWLIVGAYVADGLIVGEIMVDHLINCGIPNGSWLIVRAKYS